MLSPDYMHGVALHVFETDLRDVSDYSDITPAYSLPEWTFIKLVSRVADVRRPLRQLSLVGWEEEGVTPLAFRTLATYGLFTRLVSLHVGWPGPERLLLSAFFALLSATPALQTLRFGSVEPDYDDESNPGVPKDASLFPKPICRLKTLAVCDDVGIDFAEYDHLLSSSHDTLQSVELSWTFDSGLGPVIAAALQKCTRVRTMELIGNGFFHEDIIAACPNVDCLILEETPTLAEQRALKRPLRELRLVHCRTGGVSDFIRKRKDALETFLHSTSSLRKVALWMTPSDPIPKDMPVEYNALRETCRALRVRIELAMHRPVETE
ncbi:hypothetical protein EXIGLDRAFT_728089 [Exidia glandulosa HHB12029]|uniref:F-box domain-containing protein n=1 Tax=Exidia glandulosa HHB12029 TaxID=1314781 RepID=A0A165D1T9_EXIGL|nr:hypothetical protein EXIGLDRAFT_728089 [Exidia glandulosa HHB12029]